MKRVAILLLVVASGAAGCEGLSTPPEPIVSVLRHMPLDHCFALMTPATPVAPALGVADTCSFTTDNELVAGIDLVEVVIDYGPDVPLSPDTAAPPPNIAVTVDGSDAGVAIELSGEHRVGSRAYFVATLRAPVAPSRDVQIAAGVNAGFSTTVPVVFETVAPQLALTLVDCAAGGACTLPGAVGDAHVRADLPGDLGATVQLHETIDGVLQPDPIPPVTTQPTFVGTEALAAIPMPAARDGALLVFYAELDGGSPASASATIVPPSIGSALSCAPSCNLAAGSTVGLTITAPALIHPLQATVDASLDGVPQLVAAPVTLLPDQTGVAVGTLALTAPAQPGTWQIVATVAGYHAPAIVTTTH